MHRSALGEDREVDDRNKGINPVSIPCRNSATGAFQCGRCCVNLLLLGPHCNQDAAVFPGLAHDRAVGRRGQAQVPDVDGVVPEGAESPRHLRGKGVVDEELHLSRTMGSSRSLTASAA